MKYQHQQVQMFKLNYFHRNHNNQDNEWPPLLPYKWWARDRAGQRKRQQGQQELKAWHISSLSVWFFFFTFAYFLSTKFLFALRTTSMMSHWWQLATTTAHHLHPQNECRFETHLFLEFWYVKFFLSTTKWLYIFRLCTEPQPGWRQWTATTSGMTNGDSRCIICVLSLWYVFLFF